MRRRCAAKNIRNDDHNSLPQVVVRFEVVGRPCGGAAAASGESQNDITCKL